MTRAALACALVLAAAVPATAQPEQSVVALGKWVDDVLKHRPGTPDAAAGHIASWSYAGRLTLNPAMDRFLTMLRGEAPLASRTPQQEAISDLFRKTRSDPGIQPFIRRAAILHTDAAIFAEDLPEPPGDTSVPLVDARSAARSMRMGADPAPLLANDRYVLHVDGRVVGERAANWNWGFARSLLDILLDERDRAFVAEWYHGVGAYLLANGRHGDLRKHLERAAIALPDDPHVLFDRACYAELLGLPYYQVLTADPGYRNSTGRFIVVPSEESTDATAERLFRRTLEVDPGYVEARVRLARLLERRGRHDDAMSEIEKALERSPAGTVGFYARIVAGRVALAQKRFEAALQHYRDAFEMFPHAQSALLGASQAAVMIGDIPQAQAPLARLGAGSARFEADPWRDYQLGPGREVDALMAAVWARIPKS